MKEKIRKVSTFTIYLLVCLLIISSSLKIPNISKAYNTNIKSYTDVKTLRIPKIELVSTVIKATNNFENLDYGLVYYKDFNPNNKIIIFGHSGMGKGTYFNRLDELMPGDTSYLDYDEKTYEYNVMNTYKVSKKDVYLLENEYNSKKLLLITCVKGNKNKRLVVELSLKNIKTLEK